MEWPLATLIFAVLFCAVFYKQIAGLFTRLTGAGKDGLKFGKTQQSEQPSGPTFIDLMKLPVMKSAVEREQIIKTQFEKFRLETEE